MMNSTKHRGQILGEVVIAIGVIIIVLVGMSELMTRSTKTIRENKTRDEAQRLIEGKLAYLRFERDRDQNNFFTVLAVSGACSWTFTPAYGVYDCAQTITNITGGVRASVTASWSEGGQPRAVTMSSDIMQY